MGNLGNEGSRREDPKGKEPQPLLPLLEIQTHKRPLGPRLETPSTETALGFANKQTGADSPRTVCKGRAVWSPAWRTVA